MKKEYASTIASIILLLWLTACPIKGWAQIQGLVHGKLPNGLTYYILDDK